MSGVFAPRLRLLALSFTAAFALDAAALTPPATRGAARLEQEMMRRDYENQVSAHQAEAAAREQEVARAMEAPWEAAATELAQSQSAWRPRFPSVGAEESPGRTKHLAGDAPGLLRRRTWMPLLFTAAFFTYLGVRAKRAQCFTHPPCSKK